MIFTIVAVAGDNGEMNTIGQFTSRERAQAIADRWQEQDNPHHDPDGMNYSATRILRVAEWQS